jgi:hypothetical protein
VIEMAEIVRLESEDVVHPVRKFRVEPVTTVP